MNFKLTLIKLFLVSIISILLHPNSISAYYPLTWEDLNFQMGRQANWYRIWIETRTDVFDPFYQSSRNPNIKLSKILPNRGYKQFIHWKRGQTMIIETRNNEEMLLHIFFENKNLISERMFVHGKFFSTLDIMPLYLRFLSNHISHRNQVMDSWNIANRTVNQHWSDDGVFYRVGDQESGHYVLLDSKTFELKSIYGTINRSDGKEWKINIEFSHFKKFIGQRIPQKTEFFLDGRIFKRVSVVSVKEIERIPILALKEQVMTKSLVHNASININYAR